MANLNFTLTQDAVTAFAENKKITITAIEYYDSNNTLQVRIDGVTTSISTITADQRVLSIAGGYSSTTPPTAEIKIFKIFVKCTIEGQSGEVDFAKYEDITNPIYIFAANKDFTISVLLKLGIQANDADVIEVTGEYSIAPATTSREGVVQLATDEQVRDGIKLGDHNMPLVVQPGTGFSLKNDNNVVLCAKYESEYNPACLKSNTTLKIEAETIKLASTSNSLIQITDDEISISNDADGDVHVEDCNVVFDNDLLVGRNLTVNGQICVQNNDMKIESTDDGINIGYYSENELDGKNIVKGIKIPKDGGVVIEGSTIIPYALTADIIGVDKLNIGQINSPVRIIGKNSDEDTFECNLLKYRVPEFAYNDIMVTTGVIGGERETLILIPNSISDYGKYIIADENTVTPLSKFDPVTSGVSIYTFLQSIRGHRYINGYDTRLVLLTEVFFDNPGSQQQEPTPIHSESFIELSTTYYRMLYKGALSTRTSSSIYGALGVLIKGEVSVNISDYIDFIEEIKDKYYREYEDQVVADCRKVVRITNTGYKLKTWNDILS